MLAEFEVIAEAARTDAELAGLYGQTCDLAMLYLFAKERQKGCDGLGEVNNLKDDLASAIENMLKYCRERAIITDIRPFDTDTLLDGIAGKLRAETGAQNPHP